jgi:hypothetical protein
MPDQWGRPTFGDWMGVAGAFNAIADRNKANEQELVNKQAYEAANMFIQNPDMLDLENAEKDLRLSDFDQEAVYKGRIMAFRSLADKSMMDAKNLEKEKALAQKNSQEVKQGYTQALTLYQAGDKQGAAGLLEKAFNTAPGGFKAKTVKMENREPGFVLTSALGNSSAEPMTIDEAIGLAQEKPEIFAPETFYDLQLKTQVTNRAENTERLLNPTALTDENGDTVYQTLQIDPKAMEPRVTISNKPLYYPDHKLLDVTDIEGKHAPDTWKAIQELEESRAKTGKTKAETDKIRAETQQILGGKNSKPENMTGWSGLINKHFPAGQSELGVILGDKSSAENNVIAHQVAETIKNMSGGGVSQQAIGAKAIEIVSAADGAATREIEKLKEAPNYKGLLKSQGFESEDDYKKKVKMDLVKGMLKEMSGQGQQAPQHQQAPRQQQGQPQQQARPPQQQAPQQQDRGGILGAFDKYAGAQPITSAARVGRALGGMISGNDQAQPQPQPQPQPQQAGGGQIPPEVQEKIKLVYQNLRRQGLSPEEAKAKALQTVFSMDR